MKLKGIQAYFGKKVTKYYVEVFKIEINFEMHKS